MKCLLPLWAAFCCLFVTPAILAQQTPTPIELFAELPSKSMVRISPSGNRFAYRLTNDDQDAIVVYDRKAQKVAGAVAVGDINPENVYFIDDNRLLLRVSEYTRIDYMKTDVSTAYLYDLNKKKLSQLLVPGKGIYRWQTGLGRVAGLSKSGEHLYMPAFTADTIAGGANYSLMRINLGLTRVEPRIYQGGDKDGRNFWVDRNDNVIARERYNNRTNMHVVEAKHDGDWVTIFEEETEVPRKGFSGLTSDMKHLVMSSTHGSDMRSYYKLALADGAIEGPIFSREDKEVAGVLTDINRVVYGVYYSGFLPEYEFFSPKLNQLMAMVKEALPNAAVRIADYTPDWNTIIFQIENNEFVSDYFLLENGSFSFLTGARNDALAKVLSPVEISSYKARDGLTIPTLLTYPAGKERKDLPAIMLPHGGPESYDSRHYDWVAQYFADRGYLVIQPQFRGSRGFGVDHTLKGWGQWGKSMQDDLTDGVNTLAKQGVVNPGKVCIVGFSYGGYAAMAGATFTPDVYQCSVAISGVSDLKEMLRDEKRDYGSDHWVVSYWTRFMANNDLKDDYLETVSPANFANQVKIPMLLVHGEIDEVVPLEQSEIMLKAMKKAGKEVEMVEIEDEGHHFLKASSRLQLLKAVEPFVQKHLG